MKAIAKYLMMTIAVMALCVNFSSCKEDEGSPTGINDFYVECDIAGGGLDSSEISTLKSALNLELSALDLEALEVDQAIYVFDKFVKELKYEFSDGLGYDEELMITFYLKTTDGKTVKKSTLKITENNCTIS